MNHLLHSRITGFCVAIALVIGSTGCIHSGTYQIPTTATEVALDDVKRSSILEIECDQNYTMSSDHFKMIHIDFDNNTDRWMRIESVQIFFADETLNRNVQITAGTDLVSWYESASVQARQKSYSRAVFLGALAAFGEVLTETSDEPAVAVTGTLLSVGAYTSLMVADYREQSMHIRREQMFPDGHVLAGPFAVPPGMLTQKWLLFDTHRLPAETTIKSFLIDVRTEDGKKWRYGTVLSY